MPRRGVRAENAGRALLALARRSFSMRVGRRSEIERKLSRKKRIAAPEPSVRSGRLVTHLRH